MGQQVRFSISEREADFQTCTVTENPPGGIMRVRCEAFKHWPANTYIVYSQRNLKPAGRQGDAARTDRPRSPASIPNTPARPPEDTTGQEVAAGDLCVPGARLEGEWGIGWYEVTVKQGRDAEGMCIVSFDGYDPALWSRRNVRNLRARGSGSGAITKPHRPVTGQNRESGPVQAGQNGGLAPGEYTPASAAEGAA